MADFFVFRGVVFGGVVGNGGCAGGAVLGVWRCVWDGVKGVKGWGKGWFFVFFCIFLRSLLAEVERACYYKG